MPSEPIFFYNPYTGKVEREEVIYESMLRFLYGSPLGFLTLQSLVKRLFLSRWFGLRIKKKSSRKKILPYIKYYHVDTKEFEKEVEEFDSFNDFFIRKLKPEARPVQNDPDGIAFPCDGRHLGFQDVSELDGIYVKGQKFDLSTFLQDEELAEKYRHGTLVLSRLAPADYHRFHFPLDGIPGESKAVGGFLFSVNPISLRKNINYLFQNKRMICQFDTLRFGKVLLIEVGATNIGSICQKFIPGKSYNKGDEKGYFEFGGSMCVTIFEQDRIKLCPYLIENSSINREIFSRFGDTLGKIL